ncbi:NGG1p interacting factor NIF3 [Halobacteriovorax sp. GB3]|uniref:NGG1p interacting factor NIF3 n=1 Tax=Halobacteriovorax sp. GB3 TaxID=2719615 RepID=UPI00235E1051|nr:NGG1p interacting factor NIF3 [Halobacteriovorax sp. GB3]MDD0852721.1 NGG1p interacting factor NIF3 [Halobacteriovorax sp. GB3]
MKKIVFFVPKKDCEKVKMAMFQAGGGTIGDYDYCAFEGLGVGQFRPGNSANPTIGKLGELERVEEMRVEMICKEDYLSSCLQALVQAHPYEEPAIDVIEVIDYKNFLP